MDWAPTNTRTIDLGYEQLLTFVGRPGTRVRVLYGSMWLTEEGRDQDIFAACGDEVLLKTGGISVIEGLGAARVQLIEPAKNALRTLFTTIGKRVWQRVRARLRMREVLARFVMLLVAVAVSIGLLAVASPGPLVVEHAARENASTKQKVSAASAVLNDLASARIGFLAVN
jgi:hypothetical protein